MFRALDELAIHSDLIVVASMGAFVGSALAAKLAMPQIEALAFDLASYRLARGSSGRGMQLDGTGIAELVYRTLGVQRFGQLRTPLAVVASDAQTQRPDVDGDRAKRDQIDADAELADRVLHPYFGHWVTPSREFRVTAARAAEEQTKQQANRLLGLFR